MTVKKEHQDATTLTRSVDHQQEDKEEGNVKLNSFSLVLVFLSCIGGFLFGYDTGIISGSIVLIDDDFDLR